jgi:hypothetical protein
MRGTDRLEQTRLCRWSTERLLVGQAGELYSVRAVEIGFSSRGLNYYCMRIRCPLRLILSFENAITRPNVVSRKFYNPPFLKLAVSCRVDDVIPHHRFSQQRHLPLKRLYQALSGPGLRIDHLIPAWIDQSPQFLSWQHLAVVEGRQFPRHVALSLSVVRGELV